MEEGGEKIKDGQDVPAVAAKVEKKETELSPEVLETVLGKKEAVERLENEESIRERARLQKERGMVSEKYTERLEKNKRFMEELKHLLGRSVDLGNAVQEEEALKTKLEEIDKELAGLKGTDKANEVEEESVIEIDKEMTMDEEPKKPKESIEAKGMPGKVKYALDLNKGKDVENLEEFPSAKIQEQVQPLETEKGEEAIEMKPEVEKAEVQREKIEIKPANPEDLEKFWEKVFSSPECMAGISAAIKEIFGKKEKWEALKDMTVEEIESNPTSRKRIIRKIESFRDRYRESLGGKADPNGSESVKEWISRIVGLSLLSENEKKEAA